MDYISTEKALKLTERNIELSNEADKICKVIGDMPVAHFPFLRDKLIELHEEMYENAIELYAYWIQERQFWSASLLIESQLCLEKALYLLKTAA